MPKGVAGLDPRVAIFVMGALSIIALGGMAFGYEVDIKAFGGEVRLSKPTEAKDNRLRRGVRKLPCLLDASD